MADDLDEGELRLDEEPGQLPEEVRVGSLEPICSYETSKVFETCESA